MGKVLVLRNCGADMVSSRGFVWPKSGPVEAPDWNPEPKCGGGLHGLLWGDGDWSLLRSENNAIWQVVEVDESELVKIDDQKVKFRRGDVLFSGDMARAITDVLCSQIRFRWLYELAKKKSSGNSSKAASSGNYSTAASSGDSSKAASSGNYSTAASSGDSSKAEAQGENTVAMVAGIGGEVKAGPHGAFAIVYLKNNRPRILVGHVGEKGIKADTWYEVKNGRLSKV